MLSAPIGESPPVTTSIAAPASLVHLPSNKWVYEVAPSLYGFSLDKLEIGLPLLTPSGSHAAMTLRGHLFAGRDSKPVRTFARIGSCTRCARDLHCIIIILCLDDVVLWRCGWRVEMSFLQLLTCVIPRAFTRRSTPRVQVRYALFRPERGLHRARETSDPCVLAK